MATSTFERKIEITSPDALKKLVEVMTSEPSGEPISEHPFGSAEREGSKDLLKQWLSRSKH